MSVTFMRRVSVRVGVVPGNHTMVDSAGAGDYRLRASAAPRPASRADDIGQSVKS
jgi:hypothetical protein